MVNFIRRLPFGVEFVLVLSLALGWFVIQSIQGLLAGSATQVIDDESLASLWRYELIMLMVLAAFLYVRGCRPHHLGLHFMPQDILAGSGLFFACLAAVFALVVMVATVLGPQILPEPDTLAVANIQLSTMVLVCLINPFFVELFVCGYVISALKNRYGIWFAINVSVLLRLSYHLGQGSMGIMLVLPVGLVLAIWFAKTGRLWPLVVTHFWLDVLGLYSYVE